MSAVPTPRPYTPKLQALPKALDLHTKSTLQYSEDLWKRAEGAILLGKREAIDAVDVEVAIAELLVLRQGGGLSGAMGGLLAGAGLGAMASWLPDVTKVTAWHWGLAGVVMFLGL